MKKKTEGSCKVCVGDRVAEVKPKFITTELFRKVKKVMEKGEK